MKAMKYVSMLLIMLTMSISMISCGSDDDDPTNDYASAVAGVYTGKLTINNNVVKDVYTVRVDKISSTAVCVSAEFYSEGSENYNISYVNGQYMFKSESSVNITITVTGKVMNISYLGGNGYLYTYNGSRD